MHGCIYRQSPSQDGCTCNFLTEPGAKVIHGKENPYLELRLCLFLGWRSAVQSSTDLSPAVEEQKLPSATKEATQPSVAMALGCDVW
jgi:hypothetical protein